MHKLITFCFILSLVFALAGLNFAASGINSHSISNKNTSSSTNVVGGRDSIENNAETGGINNHQQLGISLCILSGALFLGACLLIHKYGYTRPTLKLKQPINQ